MHPPLPYDPGPLPTEAPPHPGENLELTVPGWPPWKDAHFSIRNPRHRHYQRFVELRRQAIKAMRGRAWYRGPVGMALELRALEFEPGRSLFDYVSGIQDTLDGAHGSEFTYLPVAYEDDCQIVTCEARLVPADRPSYTLRICFMAGGPEV